MKQVKATLIQIPVIFLQYKNVYQLHRSKSFAVDCFVLLSEPAVVAVMVQVLEFDLLLILHFQPNGSKENGPL